MKYAFLLASALLAPTAARADEAIVPVEYRLPVVLSAAPAETVDIDGVRYRAVRKSATVWEITFQALNAVDALQTCYVVSERGGHEANPVLSAIVGKRPSCGAVLGIKAVGGLLHWLLFAKMRDRNPGQARQFAQISVFVQGTIVGLNFKHVF